jgi:Ca-activated chloride channel family protein
MNKMASALTGLAGERVALSDVSVSAVLQDLLAEVTVSQTYRNDERVNIEAVYTFPLPLDSVLLDLEVEIGGRVLKGVVVEKKAAEKKYEDAVDSGDAAVMLEAIEPGLYTMNVGNLLPRETAKITFRYAILYRWVGDWLRFFLPTTIAPRFGESPHQPHQVPEASLTVENQFSLRVDVFGALRDAQFICPSHAVELIKSPDKAVLSLQQPKAVMDRDFILNVKAPQATRSFVLCGQDGEGMTAIASFQPFFPGLQQPRPLALAIVIDCSGSMQGDSMEQAKQALDGILESLQPEDRVTLIAFGNSTNALSNHLVPCNKTNLTKARRFAKSLDANMGGTEIGNALREAYAALGHTEAADLFLVTDGEVSDWESVVDEATKSGHRIFKVGVGSAVSEAFVRGLAAATGGECELVSPREGMADRVVRHFWRMRAPRAKRVAVHWPDGAANIGPSRIGAVFEGDTVVACASFDRLRASGSAVLEVETDKGEIVRQELALPTAPSSSSPAGVSTVARVAAATRLRELDPEAGLATALRYQLVSPWTNWLVFAERPDDEKAQDLPELRKVPQTLAAGWGGVGTVAACLSVDALAQPRALFSRSDAYLSDMAHFEAADEGAPRRIPGPDIPEPFRRLLTLIEDAPDRLDARHAINLLREAGLATEFDDLFRHAADLGLNVEVIAVIVLAGLLGGPLGEYLSVETQSAVASLQDHAQQATEAIREMGRHGSALVRVTADRAGRDILRPDQADAVEETMQRVARFRDLLDHLQDCARRSAEKLKEHEAEHAKRNGRLIA